MTDDGRAAAELRSAAAFGLRWSAFARPASEVIQLVSMVVLAHLIAPADFGRYAVALIAQEIAYMLIASGLTLALIQRKDLERRHLQTGMALGLAGGAVLAVLMLLAAGGIVAPIFGARTALFVELLAPLCLISAAGTVPNATLSRRMAFRRLSEIEVLSTMVRAFACIGLAIAGFGGESLIYGTLAAGLTSSGMAWASAPPPLPSFDRAAARELLAYALPVSVSSIGWVGFSNVDYAIIGARLGALQAGLYFRAYTLAVEYQKKIGVVMQQVGFPVLSRTQSNADLAALRSQMVRLLTMVMFPMLALLAIVAPVLVPFVFGDNWAAASTPVQILAIGGASNLVTNAVGTVLMATARTRALLGFGLGHFLAYGLAVFIVVPLGISAVAVAAAVVHTAFLVGAYALMLRGTGERPLRRLWDDVGPATISCLGMVAVVLPVNLGLSAAHAPPVIQLALVGLLAAPAYLLALRTWFPDSFRGLRKMFAGILPESKRLHWARRRLVPTDGGPAGV